MAAMNESAGFISNQSVERYDINSTGQQELDTYIATIRTCIYYVAFALGIPGNILSAIVWLRRHVTAKNSSAIYLAALAINDLVCLLINLIASDILGCGLRGSFCLCLWYPAFCTVILEPLFVLGFSTERMIAIVRPLQAKQLCTANRAKKVVAGFIVLSLTTAAADYVSYLAFDFIVVNLISRTLFDVVVPVAVLVINMIVLCEIRQAFKHSAANLELQQRQQSTSSNSAVPTIMLITTSFLHVFLCGTYSTAAVVYITSGSLSSVRSVFGALSSLVFAYNFYVYMITGKQFRSELYKLFRCCSTSSSAAAAAPGDNDDDDDARMARRAHNETPV